MGDKPIIRRTTVTSSRSWNMNDLSSAQRSTIEKLKSDGGLDGSADAFSAEIENGVVTINGKRYESMDDVPAAYRERIETLRLGMGADGDLMKLLDEMTAQAAVAQDTQARMDMGSGVAPSGVNTAAPGAVPTSNAFGKLLRVALVVICAVAAWAAMQHFKLV
jgi:hypothetical protein